MNHINAFEVLTSLWASWKPILLLHKHVFSTNGLYSSQWLYLLFKINLLADIVQLYSILWYLYLFINRICVACNVFLKTVEFFTFRLLLEVRSFLVFLYTLGRFLGFLWRTHAYCRYVSVSFFNLEQVNVACNLVEC